MTERAPGGGAGGASDAAAASGIGEKYGLPSPHDLDDETVKLVAYTIVSIKRDRERVMPKGAGSVVVAERMSPESFASWRIAEYLASDKYRDLDPADKLEDGERKDLRVDYVVSRRWPRQPRSFERRQLAVLEGIRTELAEGS